MSDQRESGTQRTSAIQKLFTGPVSPSRAAAMEAESRTWMVRCPYCGYERSAWDTGGVKYKAVGRSRWLMRCPNCGRFCWHIVYRPAGQGRPADGFGTAGPPLPLATSLSPAELASFEHRRRLRWILSIGAAVLGIVAFVAILLLVVSNLVQPIVTTGDTFMDSLKSADYAKAYALCTPDLQKALGSVSGLANLTGKDRPARWEWSGRSIRNGVGSLDGSLSYASGKTGTVHLTLTQIGSEWKIKEFRLNFARSYDPTTHVTWWAFRPRDRSRQRQL